MKGLLSNLDKAGAVLAVFAAAAAPCCLPLFAPLGAALGLSFLERFEPQMGYVIQLCVLASLAGSLFGFRRHRSPLPLLIAFAGTICVFVFYFDSVDACWVYLGFTLLAIGAVWNTVATHRAASRPLQVKLQSVVTCPYCGFQKEETMPTDSCQFFYECTSCGKMLRPKPGDCCVYCSYGSVPCPPIQLGQACC